MSHYSGHFYFGTLTKSLGLKGEMILKNLSEDADLSKTIDVVFILINNQLTPFFVEKISFRKRGEAVLQIQDIASIEKTAEFLKKDIFLENTFLLEKEEGFIEFKDLIGYAVKDKNYGSIGKIRNVLSYPQQEIFEIVFNGTEILIPAAEDFIEKIDVKSKTISLNTPPGLIDIYLKKSDEEEE